MTEKTVPESTYRKHVLRARNTRNHFTFCRDWVLIMKRDCALFVQDILNRAGAPKTKRKFFKCEDGVGREFFLCTFKYLRERSSLRWGDDAQKTHLNFLKKSGFVRVLNKGQPQRRWLWIDILAIETKVDEQLEEKKLNDQKLEQVEFPLIEKGEPKTTKVGTGGIPTDSLGGIPTDKNVHIEQEQMEERTKTPLTPLRENEHKEVLLVRNPPTQSEILSNRLIYILEKHNLARMSKQNKETWKRNIYKEAKEASQEWGQNRLEQGLAWFEENIRSEFTPRLYGSEFFSSFRRIDSHLQIKEQEEAKKKSIPDFCYKLSDKIFNFLNSVQTISEQETDYNKAQALHSIYVNWGGNESAQEKLEAIVVFYKKYYDDYFDHINIPRKVNSVRHFCNVIDWINTAYQKQKQEEELIW